MTFVAAAKGIYYVGIANYSAPNVAQSPAELCQMYSCLGEHYNPSSYYYSTLLSTRAIAIYSPDQQKKFNYPAPIKDIELRFWG